MTERPILFSGPMVRAILAGTKTQTRRRVKPEPRGSEYSGCGPAREYLGPPDAGKWGAYFPDFVPCPYGQPGSTLWVRETHRFDGISQRIGVREKRIDALSYRADMEGDQSCDDCAWRPSIFMPRWASRITLEIVAVRVERLQDISESDAIAEGIERVAQIGILRASGWRNYLFKTAHPSSRVTPTDDEHRIVGYMNPIRSYRSLWQSINGHGSWDANPWVWCIEFRRIQP